MDISVVKQVDFLEKLPEDKLDSSFSQSFRSLCDLTIYKSVYYDIFSYSILPHYKMRGFVGILSFYIRFAVSDLDTHL